MPSVLDKIVETKRRELEALRKAVPEAEMRARARAAAPPRDFYGAVMQAARGPAGIAVIAEMKKASPSAGVIVPHYDPASIARVYDAAGAAAVSVLTDETYFQGKLEHVAIVKGACARPVLRKDFTLERYHVCQARAAGADAVLLIAEVLPPDALVDLASLAGELGMTTLIEAHDPTLVLGLAAVIPRIRGPVLLGINNRNLALQKTDLATTLQLAPRVKDVAPVVSESGIQTRADVLAIQAAGASAMLVGESILRAPDPAAQIRHLLGAG